jgi:hypothetical protein
MANPRNGKSRAAPDQSVSRWRSHRPISEIIAGLSLALGDGLRSLVLYGPAARGEKASGDQELHLLVVLADLDLDTLTAAGPSLRRWVGRDRPTPRLFTQATLRQTADVFPIELAEIVERHLVLHGSDPLAALPALDGENLRLQCERELREKLMRLQEGYALSRGKEADLARLIASSFAAFALVFRGCVRLLGDVAPDTGLGAAEAFSRRAGIDPAPFAEADRLRRGESVGSVRDLFARYYAALDRAVDAVDRFVSRSPAPLEEVSS